MVDRSCRQTRHTTCIEVFGDGFARCAQTWQLFLRDADELQDGFIVLIAADVVVDAGGQETVAGAVFTREPPADVVLHHEVLGGFREALWLMAFQPHYLWCGKTGQNLRLPRKAEKVLQPEMGHELVRLLLGAIVQPHDGLAKRSAICIDGDKSLRLPRDGDGVEMPSGKLRESLLDGTPVLLRLQLHDVGHRGFKGIFGAPYAKQGAVPVKHARLDCGRADVYPNISHDDTPHKGNYSDG